MNICIIGAGYVGLTTSVVFSHLNHNVTCVDKDNKKIKSINKGKIPIFEPGLEELLKEGVRKKNLHFTTDIESAFKNSSVIFVAVGTPATSNGGADLSYIEDFISEVSSYFNSKKTIVTKSTVPPGTNELMIQKFKSLGIESDLLDIVSNPEFLKEGTAVQDALHPDKIVIGVKNIESFKLIESLYHGIEAPIIQTDLNGAEFIKYASNAFLATKISFINELARIADKYHVNINEVARTIGLDPRISPYYLNAGLGYGGSCFPKDVQALMNAAKKRNVNTPLLEAVEEVNETQINLYVNTLEDYLINLDGKRITLWGIAFKPGTNDVRNSPAIKLSKQLKEKECEVIGYDPIVSDLYEASLSITSDMYEAIKDSDALIICTDWKKFSIVDWKKVKQIMSGNLILDGRNFLDSDQITSSGLTYKGIGIPRLKKYK